MRGACAACQNTTPMIINWTIGNNHAAFSPTIAATTGRGSHSQFGAKPIGRPTWALHLPPDSTPSLDFEVELTRGVMFNATNPATQHQTGTEFHLDGLVNEHVSHMLAFGVTGRRRRRHPVRYRRVPLY